MIGKKHTIQLKENLADLYLPSDHPVGFWPSDIFPGVQTSYFQKKAKNCFCAKNEKMKHFQDTNKKGWLCTNRAKHGRRAGIAISTFCKKAFFHK